MEKLCTISVLTNHSTGEKNTDCCFQINTTMATLHVRDVLMFFKNANAQILFQLLYKREVKKAKDKTNLKGSSHMIRSTSVHKDVSSAANFSSLTVHENCNAKTLIHVDTSRLMRHLLCIYQLDQPINLYLIDFSLSNYYNLNSKKSSCKLLIIIDVIICVLWKKFF